MSDGYSAGGAARRESGALIGPHTDLPDAHPVEVEVGGLSRLEPILIGVVQVMLKRSTMPFGQG